MLKWYAIPCLVIIASVSAANVALANEIVAYTYDAQGRLIEAAHSGTGDNATLDIKYQFDLAGNRTANNMTGSKNKGQQVIVLPINGFTIIPINP